MVIPDLSAPQTQPYQSNSFKPAVASVADRFLSFVLDFLIFSPVVGLLISTLIRQAKVSFLVSSSTDEALIFALLIGFVAVVSSAFLQAIFLFYFQATPGQLFTKLKVISFPERSSQLTFNQCLARAFLWWTSGFAFFLPFLEVLSHPLRRAFYERASDTVVVTLKSQADLGPHAIESRFFSSWLRLSFILLVSLAVVGAFKSYRSLTAGHYRSVSDDSSSASICSEKSGLSAQKGLESLDLSLTLYMADALTSDCLIEKADQTLWAATSQEEEDFAYLAKYLATDGEKKQERYLSIVCEHPSSDACHLAKYMSEAGKLEDLKEVRSDLNFAKFLLADEMFLGKDYAMSLNILKQLQKVSSLRDALEKRYIRSIWALNEQLRFNTGRSPASSAKELLEDFKEKYELP